ncbi:MAG: T9SS type A sorting domain-containing protein, partial [Bacteroidetes bacterium]|nr:T9SS type A sorting domain-containing protein [Bacteroidota bacterium]
GATTQTIFLNSTGLITVAVTDNNNCTTKDTISVNVAGLPNADFFISPNDTVYAWDFDVNFINLSTKGKYFWEFGDGDTLTVNNSTSPSQNHIYPDTGTYCVTLIVTETENDCGADTLTRCFTLLKSVTRLENELIPGLSIYPNPASEFVSIQFSESLPGRWRYHLMDLAGRKLFSKELGTLFPNQKEDVVLGSLPPNVYFLLVENEQMRQVFKIVKQ